MQTENVWSVSQFSLVPQDCRGDQTKKDFSEIIEMCAHRSNFQPARQINFYLAFLCLFIYFCLFVALAYQCIPTAGGQSPAPPLLGSWALKFWNTSSRI